MCFVGFFGFNCLFKCNVLNYGIGCVEKCECDYCYYIYGCNLNLILWGKNLIVV